VYKYELYVRITKIIADKFRSHAYSGDVKYAIDFELPMLSGQELVIAAASNGFTDAPK
jgi:hypothetical protein